jgi:alpha-L-fucosidase
MKTRHFLSLILALFFLQASQAQKTYEPNWESLDSRPVAPWFEDAKFGIFLHWGPYSVPAWSPRGTYSEWYQYWMQTKTLFGNGDFTGTEVYDHHVRTYGEDFSYYDFGPMFTAEDFKAEEWAKLFEDAGAKYMVITSKHHDGYCLWPSETASKTWGFPWNAGEVGAQRDLLKELEVAVKNTDVKFGTYYSLYEWFHPWWQKDKKRFVEEHFHPQFKELVEGYQPDIVWTDGEWSMEAEYWKSQELLTWLFNESSIGETVVINDQYEAGMEGDHPWEECRGIGFSFGYNANEPEEDYATAQVLIYLLLNTVSNGGNLLLDIGPDGKGNIPEIMQERLLAMGEWLKVNGEAIYGTRKWDRACQWSKKGRKDWKPEDTHYLPADYILKQTVDPQPGYAVREAFFTQTEDAIYAIVPGWPKEDLLIRDLKVTPGTHVSLLGMDVQFEYVQDGKHLRLKLPQLKQEELPCEYAYVFKIAK